MHIGLHCKVHHLTYTTCLFLLYYIFSSSVYPTYNIRVSTVSLTIIMWINYDSCYIIICQQCCNGLDSRVGSGCSVSWPREPKRSWEYGCPSGLWDHGVGCPILIHMGSIGVIVVVFILVMTCRSCIEYISISNRNLTLCYEYLSHLIVIIIFHLAHMNSSIIYRDKVLEQ